jgi:hypothetical protein
MLCYTKLYNAGAIIETKKPISYNNTEILIEMMGGAIKKHMIREKCKNTGST